MNTLTSLPSLQGQYAFEIGIDIVKKKLLFSAVKKKFYQAKWLNENQTPIILIEIEGNDTINEILTNITLEHAHIVKTYGLVRPTSDMSDRPCLLVLQEYAKDGSLGELLYEKRFIPQTSVLIQICIQISDAMTYLAGNDIIHGDLQCRNVLVFKTDPVWPKKNLVKLIDFGLTRDGSKHSGRAQIYPIRFAALEIIRSEGGSGYTEKSDVYSFGVLIWEAFSQAAIPFADIDNDQLVAQMKLDGQLLKKPSSCPDQLWKLVLQCWKTEPRERPKFREIRDRLQQMQISKSGSLSE